MTRLPASSPSRGCGRWFATAARCTRGRTRTDTSGGRRENRSHCGSSGLPRQLRMATMAPLDLVTGAFSYSGSHIARRLLDAGRRVRTLSFHPGRPHPLQASVQALPYRFDEPEALAASLAGVSTLYNTYWVRFDHGDTSFEQAIERSHALFTAAQRAGVERIVHLSITNPSLGSPLPYFRGKALVEGALAQVGVPYSIVRPTWIFGGDHDVLVNNIAWILRHTPVFAVPGSGAYPVQPVHVEDLASICTNAARADADVVVDAAG